MADGSVLLEMAGVSKRYGGVTALAGVDFACRTGSIHAILGENGAGKSTLIKIASGVVAPDEGVIRLGGVATDHTSPSEAARNGIVSVFQELSLLPDLSVADNISIADPPLTRLGLIDARAQMRRAEDLLARLGCEDVNPAEHVSRLPLSRRQMVEIAKALGRSPKLLILDEATSALTAADVAKVYEVLFKLRGEGIGILFISHRMHEVDELADTLSVFRNGRHIETFAKGAHTGSEIVEMMIGREIKSAFPPKPMRQARPKPLIEIERLGWFGRLQDISFSVAPGEIVGLGGLDGQGQRDLLLALFGVLKGVEGEVKVDGRAMGLNGPAEAKTAANRIALIPEDRKTEGLMLPMSTSENLTLAALGKLTRGIFVDRAAEDDAVKRMIERLSIKVGDPTLPVANLSGGNQQKVVIAKWLMTEPRILLLNDPTRGIDVGTKQEIYQLLRHLADAGTAIVFYSTDYDELIGCCDRVLILYQGRVVRTLEGDQITETAIVASSLNIDTTERTAAMPVDGSAGA